MPTRSFGLVDYKVREAEYFLDEMKRVGRKFDFSAVQFCASAFVSAARSVTFAMQASLADHPRFEDWYKPKQDALKQNGLARFFHQFRTITQHLGENVVSGSSSGPHGPMYHFVPCADLREVPKEDVVTACEVYFRLILELVYDCYVELGDVVDGQQYFTAEVFARAGKTIEDAAEELGFPRGWTRFGDSEDEPYKWKALRARADGCQIEEQFERWLGKYVPRPEPLPPFRGDLGV
jgi:hypothetical protein